MTPFELRGHRWYKRDDLFRHPSGVNGGKWRQCLWLVNRLKAEGKTHVVSGASILSPQLPMTAVAAQECGLQCTLVIGGTTVERASRQPGVAIARDHGADFYVNKVGYNPALQAAVRQLSTATGAGVLRYGVAPDPASPLPVLLEFHGLGAEQTLGMPREVEVVVLPFGSGNTAASVLLGLARHGPPALRRVELIGIGPSRWAWLNERMALLGHPLPGVGFDVRHWDLHGQGIVSYHQRVPYTVDGIRLHPTYEGKVARWLDTSGHVPEWAHGPAGRTLFWNVGGPL